MIFSDNFIEVKLICNKCCREKNFSFSPPVEYLYRPMPGKLCDIIIGEVSASSPRCDGKLVLAIERQDILDIIGNAGLETSAAISEEEGEHSHDVRMRR